MREDIHQSAIGAPQSPVAQGTRRDSIHGAGGSGGRSAGSSSLHPAVRSYVRQRTEENELTGDNRDRRAVFRDQASSVATGRKDENCARVLLGRSGHSSHSDSLDGLRGAFCGVAKLVE